MEKTLKNICIALAALAAAAAAGVLLGGSFIAPDELIGSPILKLRLLRVAAAFAIGSALSLSGMVFQCVLRNPLAEPYILGISSGAGLGAAGAFVLGISALSVWTVPAMALGGALCTLFAVLRISRAGGGERLLLSGVIAGTVCSSLLMFMISNAGSDDLAAASWWMLGDLQSVNSAFLFPMLAVTFAGVLLLRLKAGVLDLLALGDNEAFFLGVDVKKERTQLIFIASMMAALAVSLAGVIGFCGLVIPHIIRRIYGSGHRKSLFMIFCWGGTFLIICDLLSRTILPGQEIPVGVLTSMIGGPLFLWLLNVHKRSRI